MQSNKAVLSVGGDETPPTLNPIRMSCMGLSGLLIQAESWA